MSQTVECSREKADALVAAGGRILEHRGRYADPNAECLVEVAADAPAPKASKAKKQADPAEGGGDADEGEA